MGIFLIGKSREANSLTGEQYKALVRQYLEQSGFALLTDSSIEGHLSDMVMINPERSVSLEYYIECKATDVGPNDKEFILEVMRYFIEWRNKPAEERFKLMVFAIKLNDPKELEKLFGAKYSNKNLKDWYAEQFEKLPEKEKGTLKDADQREIIGFFSQIDLYQADMQALQLAIEEKGKRSILSMQRYAEKLKLVAERRGTPLREKSDLISNLILIKIPKKYYAVTVKEKTRDAFYKKYNNIEIPPITFYQEKKLISTFVPLDEKSPIAKSFTGKPEIVNLTEKTSPQFVVALINQHLKRILWKKGLTRITESNIYYFQAEEKDGKVYHRYVQAGQRKKCVSRVYKKEEKEEKEEIKEEAIDVDKVNYVFHHAAEITAKYIWEKFYIQVRPTKEYTTDGRNLLDGKKKAALDRYFRNPAYNRNSNKLSDIKFWKDLLINEKTYIMPQEEWFKTFIFGEMEVFPFNFKPQPLTDIQQAKLGEFENDKKHPDS